MLGKDVREQVLDSSGGAKVASMDRDIDPGMGLKDFVAKLQRRLFALRRVVVQSQIGALLC